MHLGSWLLLCVAAGLSASFTASRLLAQSHTGNGQPASDVFSSRGALDDPRSYLNLDDRNFRPLLVRDRA